MRRPLLAWLIPLAIAFGAAGFVALVGSTLTDLGPWYRGLTQPGWAPPDAAFGIVWTLIFACAALAAVETFRAIDGSRDVETLIGLFAFNGFLNLLWSFMFFRMQRPDWALVEVFFLFFSVLALVIFCGRRSRLAGALLLPYLLWVGCAAMLNLAIVRLNGPFG